jgi:hypothetical protein
MARETPSETRVTLTLRTPDALRFFTLLNTDNGLRDNAASKLIYHDGPESDRLALVKVLGRLSAALYDALKPTGLLDTRSRRNEVKQLAFQEDA